MNIHTLTIIVDIAELHNFSDLVLTKPISLETPKSIVSSGL